MRKALFGVFLALFCAIAAKAQAPYKVEVAVDGGRTPVISELETRISATTRYTLTSSAITAQLLVGVDCIRNQSTDGVLLGYTCDAEVIYYPSGRYAFFPQPATGYIAACGVDAPSDCAEALFDDFVKSTQPDKLKKYDEAAYSEYTFAYEQGYKMGMATGLASCNAEHAQKKQQK